MKRDGHCKSLWQETIETYKPQSGNSQENFDVIVCGGGITGITTALLLQEAGKNVMVAEARNICFGTTGGTTAHLNTFLDTPYSEIQKKFGDDGAKEVAEAVRKSLTQIESNIRKHQIDCDYRKADGFLFAQDGRQEKELEEIFDASRESHVACEWTDAIPVPIEFTRAARFTGQACFHPVKYVYGLARAFEAAGGVILENCRITGIKEGDQIKVSSSKGEFTCAKFIYATHIPPGVNLLHFRCAPYRSYAMACKLEDESGYPEGLVYDMYEPYHYYRTQEIEGEKYLIAGGEDHKTGHETNTDKCFAKLEAHINKYFVVKEISQKWSSQYFEPTDGLPYIGNLPGHGDHVYVATGYSGNGITYSGLAAIMLRDLIVEGKNEYEELFDPGRIKMVAGFSNFMKEAADVVGLLFKKALPKEKLKDLADLAPGESRIVNYEGAKMALYKDEQGNLHAVNSACTHIKCDVAWNSAEQSWDCPCHGSRFGVDGEMLTGPARKDLEKIDISA